MRFHVVGLPFTQTNEEFPACAFTMKVRKFCKMMHNLGHTVYLYSGEYNTTPCFEHVQIVTEQERSDWLGNTHYTMAPFDANHGLWRMFNERASAEIAKRAEKQDFICVIGGTAHQPIALANPDLMTVEFGIGYPGTFAKFRVFESYGWMHAVYGTTTTNAATLNGNWFDAVISGYIDPDEFDYGPGDGDYYFFIGRLIERKGYQIAADVCEHLGERLIIAGIGTPPRYGEYIGPIGLERAEYYRHAKATFVPTHYIEPFGTVAPEAQMCGTPTITTDWGAFPDTVINGVTGYRCRTFKEFVEAAVAAPKLDRRTIRHKALEKYSLDVIGRQYETYFGRLLSLWGDGWYAL